jgi:hypothetical protein
MPHATLIIQHVGSVFNFICLSRCGLTAQTGTPLCSNFTYYAAVGTQAPVRFLLANPSSPGANIVAVEFGNVTLHVDDSDFDVSVSGIGA